MLVSLTDRRLSFQLSALELKCFAEMLESRSAFVGHKGGLFSTWPDERSSLSTVTVIFHRAYDFALAFSRSEWNQLRALVDRAMALPDVREAVSKA